MKRNPTPRIEIKPNHYASNDPCALCGQHTDPIVGMELFLEGSDKLVCRRCALQADPQKLAWRDWAEAMAARFQTAYAYLGDRPVDVAQVDPIDEPIRCPVCRGDRVQLASLMFSLPDGRVAYLDDTGLRAVGDPALGQFMKGITLMLRCAEGHMLARHLRPEDDRTLLTSVAARANEQVLRHELRPLWPSGSASRQEGDRD